GNAVAEDGVRQPEVGIKRTLLDERQNERAPTPADSEAGRLVAGRQRAIRAGIVVQGQGELMQIVLALRASGGFTHFLNGRTEMHEVARFVPQRASSVFSRPSRDRQAI